MHCPVLRQPKGDKLANACEARAMKKGSDEENSGINPSTWKSERNSPTNLLSDGVTSARSSLSDLAFPFPPPYLGLQLFLAVTS